MGAWLTIAALLAAQVGFVQIGTREHVDVYQQEGTSAIVLRAEGELPAPPRELLEVLLDYPSHPRFVSRPGM